MLFWRFWEIDVCFLVDTDYTYVQVAIPIVRWLRPLTYKINVGGPSMTITTLLVKEIYKDSKSYESHWSSQIKDNYKLANNHHHEKEEKNGELTKRKVWWRK